MLSSNSGLMQSGGVTDELIQRELKRQVGEKNYQHWFANKTKISFSNEQLVVGVPSPFLQDWMHRRFSEPLRQVARKLLGNAATVRFDVDEQLAVQKTTLVCCVETRGADADAFEQSRHQSPVGNGSHLPVNGRKRQTAARQTGRRTRRFAKLSDFVVGRCNELAATAVRQVAEEPGHVLNPLVIYGPVGTGKTHLLEACYGLLREKHPQLNVLFVRAEAFANYFTQALGDHKLPTFRHRFRNVDVLLVDDVDFFDGKRVIQEEFLHTVQELRERGCQFVFTCDRQPRLLTNTSESLVSHMLEGLVCRLNPPDLETRRRIVQKKAAQTDVPITKDALDYVASRFTRNVRELEGALSCLRAHHLLLNRTIDVAGARRILSELERDCVRLVRLADIEQAVCEMFAVSPSDLRSSKRQRSVSQPRMLAMFLARKYTQAGYREIGQYFGGRQHSTVLSAEKRVRRWLAEGATVQVASQNWKLADLLATLEERLLAS